jgi:hypothetical protein
MLTVPVFTEQTRYLANKRKSFYNNEAEVEFRKDGFKYQGG